jgi:hypothetical protein
MTPTPFIVSFFSDLSNGYGFSPISVCARIIWFEVKLSPGKKVLTACREAGATDKSYFDHFAIRLPAPPRLWVVW